MFSNAYSCTSKLRTLPPYWPVSRLTNCKLWVTDDQNSQLEQLQYLLESSSRFTLANRYNTVVVMMASIPCTVVGGGLGESPPSHHFREKNGRKREGGKSKKEKDKRFHHYWPRKGRRENLNSGCCRWRYTLRTVSMLHWNWWCKRQNGKGNDPYRLNAEQEGRNMMRDAATVLYILCKAGKKWDRTYEVTACIGVGAQADLMGLDRLPEKI